VESAPARPRAAEGPLAVELFVGRAALRAGASTPVALRFTLADGWHAGAHGAPSNDRPTTRAILLSTELGTLAFQFPEGTPLKIEGAEKPVPAYAGTFVVKGSLAVPADLAPGKHVLRVRVNSQACNDRVCERPASLLLSVPVEVVSAGQDAAEQHAEVFK
jgi:hypothetical protein